MVEWKLILKLLQYQHDKELRLEGYSYPAQEDQPRAFIPGGSTHSL